MTLQARLDALKERHAALELRIADEDQRDDRDEAADGEPEKKENGRPAEAGGVEDWPGHPGRHKGRVTAAIRAIPDRYYNPGGRDTSAAGPPLLFLLARLPLIERDRRQVAVLVQVEFAVPDAEHERVPLGLGEVELARLRLGGVIHNVKLGLAGLVRRARSVRGHVYLDPALSLLHGPRLLPPGRRECIHRE